MDDDTPITQAEPVPALVTVVPANWTSYNDGVARITAACGQVNIVDFYREPA